MSDYNAAHTDIVKIASSNIGLAVHEAKGLV